MSPSVPGAAGELPATYEHDGATLYLQGTAPVETAYVDDPAAARLRLAAGMELPVSDCHPLMVPVVTGLRAEQVTVTVGRYTPSQRLPDQLDCEAIGAPPYQLEVALDEPLGEREVVDEVSGAVQVHDVGQLPPPMLVPDGYTGGRLVLEDESLSRWWVTAEQHRLILERREVDAVDEWDVVVLETEVHGQPAVVTKTVGFEDLLCLRWGQGEDGLWLCSSGSPTAPLDAATLVEVAESIPPLS